MNLELTAQELQTNVIDIPITLLTCEKLEGEPSLIDLSNAIEDKVCFNYEGIMPFVCTFRGMALGDLEKILELIANPEKSYVFWGDSSLDKAAEYGGVPKLILCFDAEKCQNSYKEIKISEHADEEIDKFKEEYARCLESKDKAQLFFSHFEYDMNHVNYEKNYGNYIPEKVGEALKRIIVFGYKDDPELMECLKNLGIQTDSNEFKFV